MPTWLILLLGWLNFLPSYLRPTPRYFNGPYLVISPAGILNSIVGFSRSPEPFPSVQRIILHLIKLLQDCTVLLHLLLQTLLFPVESFQINFCTSAHILSRFSSDHASDSIMFLNALLLEATRQPSGCLTLSSS